ncbi:N/A [soil metagenome]
MNIQLKLGSISGPSILAHFEKTFDVASYNWGIVAESGGKPIFTPLSVTLYPAWSTSQIFLAAFQATNVGMCQLSVVDHGIVFQRYTLEDVIISSAGAGGTDSTGFLNITLNYSKITYTESTERSNGTLDTRSGYWDLVRNIGG